MKKTIFTFDKDLREVSNVDFSLVEVFDRKVTWWNYGTSTKSRISIRDVIYPLNTHQRNKYPLIVNYLETRPYRLSIRPRNKSHLRHILGKERPLTGYLDLESRSISTNIFDNSFTDFQNNYHNFNKLKIKIQIEDDLLDGVEKYFESGDYPIGNDLGVVNERFMLKISFISFSFLK